MFLFEMEDNMSTITRRGSYIPRARAALANYKRREGKTNTKSSVFRVFILQTIMCVIVALLCIGVKSFNLPIKEAFDNNLKYFLSYTIDYQQSFRNIKQTFYNYFPSKPVNVDGEKVNEAF